VPGDVILRGQEARPRRVLGELGDATEVESHAHGVVDLTVSQEPVVALSSDADGAGRLTESLRGHGCAVARRLFSASVAFARYHRRGLGLAHRIRRRRSKAQ